MRQDCNQFTQKELDLILLGQVAVCLDNRDTASTKSEHKAHAMLKSYSQFFHQGQQICADTFRFIHGVGKKPVPAPCATGLRTAFLGTLQTDKSILSRIAQMKYDLVLCTLESFYDSVGTPKPVL